MRLIEPIRDRSGNMIHFPPSFFTLDTARDYEELKQVITEPAFVITLKKETIYFFKLVSDDVNIVIETKTRGGHYMVTACIENPSVGYISDLIGKGGHISFSYA